MDPNPAPYEPAVALVGVSKHFGDIRAVDGVDLRIERGEFFSMLGPSGSGKTTMLRLIAGFEAPSAGTILLGGRDVTDAPPFRRDVNTVFQDYALFPHMTVARNVEYGLRVKKVPKAERATRVAEALSRVRLDGFGDRKPHQLSGGQRQRVALARALVNQPEVLLLDEPLGALDLKLREEMQIELKGMQKQLGITFIFVTHDQGEALSMSDRVAVFNQGRIEQVGTPAEVYGAPSTAFVAGFVGTSNLLEPAAARALLGDEGPYSLRPEHLSLHAGAAAAPDADSVVARGTVTELLYLGPVTRYRVTLDLGGALLIDGQSPTHGTDDRLAAGRAVTVTFRKEHALVLHHA